LARRIQEARFVQELLQRNQADDCPCSSGQEIELVSRFVKRSREPAALLHKVIGAEESSDARCGGQRLGVPRTTLSGMMRKLGITRKDY